MGSSVRLTHEGADVLHLPASATVLGDACGLGDGIPERVGHIDPGEPVGRQPHEPLPHLLERGHFLLEPGLAFLFGLFHGNKINVKIAIYNL